MDNKTYYNPQAPVQTGMPPQPPAPSQPMPVSGAPYQPPQQNMPPMAPPQPIPQMPYNPSFGLPKKVYKPFEKRDNAFLFIFLALAFILVDFAFFHYMRLGFTIAYFLIFIVSSVYLFSKDKKPSVFSVLCGGISLAGAVTFALYSDYFINSIMAILIAGLFTLYCLGISGSFTRKQGNFKLLIDLFMASAIRPIEHIGDIIGSIKASAGRKKKSLSAILGVVLALPVLVIIVPLLIRSDAAFEGLVAAIAKNIGIYLLELLIACIILPYAFSFMYGKKHRLSKAEQGEAAVKRVIPVSGCVSFLCMISVTYLVYLFSQLAYFFSAFKGLLPEGYTRSASQFARRGFYEMFAICAINVIIISLISAFSKRKGGKPSLAIKLLSLFISLFSILMLVIAMQKMRLNITTFGFTRNRLLISVFMIMMLVVLAFFIVHIFAPKVPYMQPIIIICSVIFVALSFANPDSFTYEHNLKAYQSGTVENFEVYSVSILDPSEGYLAKLSKSEDKKLSHEAEKYLLESMGYHKGDYEFTDKGELVIKASDFRSWCKAREDAKKEVKAYFDSMDPERRASFARVYKIIENGGWYDKSDDMVYGDGTGGELKYNPKTGLYEEY
jgi:hypothetical protein